MNYDDFLEQVQKDLQDSFANQTEEKYAKVTIGIGNVNKIQGESYRGITFVNGESPIKGHFNMQQAYHLSEHGYSYDEILRQVEEAIKQEVDTAPGFSLEDLQDYSKMKSTLMMQLIPQKGNEENLMKVPHQKIEDLALIYRFDAGGHSGMTATMLITNDSLKEYGMAANLALQKHIQNYAKTKGVYDAYRKSGYSRKFFEQHRAELTLHKAAKEAFRSYDSGKLPKLRELRQEYAELITMKKGVYQEYRKAKKEMQAYLTTRQNVEQVYGEDLKKEREEAKRQREEL